MTTIIGLESVSRLYRVGSESIWVLRNISFQVAQDQFVAITGPSGSGKTTLLNLIATIDRPTAGRIVVSGLDVTRLSDSELTRFRARTYGIVFQDPHLLPGLTALENVVAGRLPWNTWKQLKPPAEQLLKRVGLGHRLHHPPARLSGGERQRVAIARALLGKPRVLLADEPTGNLDLKNTEAIVSLLEELRNDLGLTVLIGTHDAFVASVAEQVINLRPAAISMEAEPAVDKGP